MSVGMVDAEDEEANIVDHPIFFCPFCGTKLQTPEEVEAKARRPSGRVGLRRRELDSGLRPARGV